MGAPPPLQTLGPPKGSFYRFQFGHNAAQEVFSSAMDSKEMP